MLSSPKLKVDWCDYKAAKFAVEKWHYSGCMPKSKLAKFGVWEDGQFVGAVVFGVGATPELCKPYGLKPIEVCELTRVSLREHRTPVSRILAIAVRMLKREMSGLRLIVSFADRGQGHHGGIYQAGGWIYCGDFSGCEYLKVNGTVLHPRTLGSRYGVGGQSIPWLRANVDPKAGRVPMEAKHRYLMPLDPEMRVQIVPLAKPYPKRASALGETPVPTGGGGSTPTQTLHEAGANG